MMRKDKDFIRCMKHFHKKNFYIDLAARTFCVKRIVQEAAEALDCLCFLTPILCDAIDFLPLPLQGQSHCLLSPPSTPPKPTSPMSVRRCPGRRSTDVRDIGLEAVEGAHEEMWQKVEGGCGREGGEEVEESF